MIRAVYGLSYVELNSLYDTLEHEEYSRALESDLIQRGLRLRWVGSDSLMWHELYAVVVNLPRESAFYRAQNPKDAAWDVHAMLLAEIADALKVANWQRGNGRQRDYPKPIPRPGVEPDAKTYGKGALPIDEMEAWLAAN